MDNKLKTSLAKNLENLFGITPESIGIMDARFSSRYRQEFIEAHLEIFGDKNYNERRGYGQI